MRVAFVIYGPLEQLTGGYLYDRQMVDGLRKRGHFVSVLSLGAGDLRGSVRPFAELLYGGFDVVVADELCHREVAPGFALLAGLRGARPTPRRVLLVHHLAEWEDGRKRRSERRCLGLADAIITTSRTSSQRLSALGFASTPCLPGADRLPLVAPVERRPGRVELLFVGSATPRKQLVFLIEVLARLDLDYALTVVSDLERDPDYGARVRATLAVFPQVARRTRLLGAVDDAELAALQASSDALVSPSDYEGYGMAIAEAVRAGLPVVATRGGAVCEVVRDGAEALLVPPRDAAALARALSLFISEPRQRAQMRRFAGERRLPRWGDSVERFERLLSSA